jgi:hypothetical protein
MTQHVVPKEIDGAADGEIVRPAFADVSDGPYLSYNLPFDKACVKHVKETFNAERVYILASGSLCRNTDYVKRLQRALGDRVAGLREGMTPHTLWSEVLEVAAECKRLRADLIVTIGGGSLTDAAKIVTLVSEFTRLTWRGTLKRRQLTTHDFLGPREQCELTRDARSSHDRRDDTASRTYKQAFRDTNPQHPHFTQWRRIFQLGRRHSSRDSPKASVHRWCLRTIAGHIVS